MALMSRQFQVSHQSGGGDMPVPGQQPNVVQSEVALAVQDLERPCFPSAHPGESRDPGFLTRLEIQMSWPWSPAGRQKRLGPGFRRDERKVGGVAALSPRPPARAIKSLAPALAAYRGGRLRARLMGAEAS